ERSGALRVAPLTGEAPFTFLWDSGDTTAILNAIPTGTYMVTVTDASGCTMAVSALLPDATPINIELTVDDATRAITSTISAGVMPYIYTWSNGDTTAVLNELISGTYELTVTDANGCTQTASAEIAAPTCKLGLLDTLGQSLMMDTISCFEQGEICLPISLDSMINFSLFLDGASYMDRIIGCRFDTFYAYTYFTLPGRGDNGPYILDEWVVNEQNFSGEFLDIAALVDSMNTWDAVGNWVLNSEILIIQGGLPTNQYGELTIRTPLTTAITTLDLNTNLTPTSTLISFAAGNHDLILIENSSNCSDTLMISQPCSDVISRDTLIIIEIKEGRSTNFSLEALFGNRLNISANQCPELLDGNTNVNLETGTSELQIEGVLEGSDDICYSIMDKNGINIQFTLRINVVSEPMNCRPFIDIDTFATTVADCENFTICVPLNYDSLLTYEITDNGTAFAGVVAACDGGNGSILNLTAPKTHQLIFTNNENCLDTVLIAINAPVCDEDLVIRDTIEVNEGGRTCLELAGLSSPFVSVQDLCPEQNGEMAMLTIDGITGCIDYTGVELGVDTACIEICDVFGFCDTITLIISVTIGDLLPPNFDAIDDAVQATINQDLVFDALANDLFTTIDTLYLVDMPAKGMATFNLDGTISYAPDLDFCDDINPDAFRYAICLNNFCDTAKVSVLVPCTPGPTFEAVDDTARTSINSPIIFNALGNDIFTSLDDMYLVESPDNGIAIFNLDGTIRYMPVTDYCNEMIPDMFQYAICLGTTCDTATVMVYVDCTSDRNFIIFNALSPNGDGANDVFQIDGIEDFPNNTVKIFNRWGNMVYEMAGYKNKWNGNWGRDNALLPDGTYFYLFDTGEGDLHGGFLEIRR
ncbi:MAG: gliding motility-associated C-terminal domain-containing protein, partial [Saprospiraceae bacterium]